MICVTLCLYQVVQLLNQYFVYAVEVQTTIGNIDTMTLPTVSVCSSYEFYGNEEESVVREVRNLFQQNAYNYEKRILDCTLVLKNGSKINCHSITKPEKYINIDYLCHAMFSENQAMTFDFRSNSFLTIDVNLTDSHNDLQIALFNENQVDINSDSIGFDYIYKATHDVTSYSYVENSFQLLPSPFKSKCIDYTSKYGFSRETLVERCTQKRYYLASPDDCRYNRKCLASWSFISEKDINYHLNYTVIDVHFSREHGIPAVARDYCYRTYSAPECQSREFDLRRTGISVNNNLKFQAIHQIVMNKPKLAGFKVTEIPALPLGETLSAIAGVMNVWSSLAISDFVFFTISLVVRLTHRKRGTSSQSTEHQVPKVRTDPIEARKLTIESLITGSRSRKCVRKANRARLRSRIRHLTMIIYFVSLMACFGHIYKICNIYIEHPFRKEVMLLKKPTFKLKPLSVCVYDRSGSNLTVLQRLDYINRLNIEDMMEGESRISDTEHRPFRDFSSIVTSFNNDRICLTLFLGLKENVTESKFEKTLTRQFSKATLKDSYFLELYVKFKYSPNGVDFVLHNHAKDLHSTLATDAMLTYRKQLDMSRTIRYHLSYITHETLLVSNHFKSECFDFKSIGFNDRNDAITQCALRKFIENRHQLPSNYLVLSDETKFSNMTFSDFQFDIEKKYCQTKYQKLDCFSTELKLLQKSNYIRDRYGTLDIILTAPQAYNYYTIQTRRNSFLEFFGNIGGTVALWIGCSFYDLNRLARLLLKKFKTD